LGPIIDITIEVMFFMDGLQRLMLLGLSLVVSEVDGVVKGTVGDRECIGVMVGLGVRSEHGVYIESNGAWRVIMIGLLLKRKIYVGGSFLSITLIQLLFNSNTKRFGFLLGFRLFESIRLNDKRLNRLTNRIDKGRLRSILLVLVNFAVRSLLRLFTRSLLSQILRVAEMIYTEFAFCTFTAVISRLIGFKELFLSSYSLRCLGEVFIDGGKFHRLAKRTDLIKFNSELFVVFFVI
jgi:hypothetical protein